MDFDPVPNLEIDGYRIAPIDQFDGRMYGDAYLIHPDGTQVDLAWESEALLPRCEKRASTIDRGKGVWQVEVVEEVNDPADLDVVLQAVVAAIAGRTPESPRCSHCGSPDTIPIAYGLPGPEMMEAAERGEIAIGGCIIEEHQPTDECRRCGANFVRGTLDPPTPIAPRPDYPGWWYPPDPDDWTDADDIAWNREDAEEEADRVRLDEVVAAAKAADENVTHAILGHNLGERPA